jgi:sugar phosphate isomerase/epimerase
MKISVFYDHVLEASRQTGLSVTEILTKLGQWGIQAVDCSIEHVKGCAAEFNEMLDEYQLTVSSIYGFFDFGKDPTPEPGYDLIDAAVEVGSPTVLVVPGFYPNDLPAEKDAARENMAQALSAIADYAQSKGVVALLEDFDAADSPVATDEGLLWFFERVPLLRCAFDTGNFMFNGVEELAAFERLSGKIAHVHCKDRALSGLEGEEPKAAADGRPLYAAAVGSGVVKMAEIVERLLKAGYEGYFAIEHFGSPDQLGYIERSAAWLLGREKARPA